MLKKRRDEMDVESGNEPSLLRRAGLRLLEVAQRTKPARRMRVLESLACGGKAQLLLIEVDGKSFLAAGGADALHTLLALPGELA